MSTQRKRYSAEFLSAGRLRRGQRAQDGLNELASTYGVHPTQITQWKHQLQKRGARHFLSTTRQATARRPGSIPSAVYISNSGNLKVELDWLKKKLVLVPPEAKRELILKVSDHRGSGRA